jgi:hypothetical protein
MGRTTGDRTRITTAPDATNVWRGNSRFILFASDIAGHPAVNQAMAIEYPKLRAKYGNSVKYAEDKTAHIRTEIGFDMVQVATATSETMNRLP